MKGEYVKRSKYDDEFRRIVTDFIHLARKEVLISTGEFSIYYYPDVNTALGDAIHRGVSVKTYLGKCDEDTIYNVISDGITAYVGNKPPEKHFMLIDKKHWIVSEKHKRYAPGTRHGPYKKDDTVTGNKLSKEFKLLIKDAELITQPNKNPENTKKILEELYS